MSESLSLCRVRLRRDVPARALAPLLLPDAPGARLGAAHRLIWALFPGPPEQTRDFLWREESHGGLSSDRSSFLVLSRRPPEDVHGLFAMDPPKAFAPVLAPGDRLVFALRANPVVSRSVPGGREKSKRCDLVAERLRGLSKAQREGQRDAAVQAVARTWLAAQGERSGFRLLDADRLRAEDDWRVVPRDKGQNPVKFSVLDMEGRLEVTDPALFVPALAAGFGKAKAFGCGLMLIRRE